MKEKNWDLGRRLICIAALTILLAGIFLGSGAAQEGDGTDSAPPAADEPVAAEKIDLSKDEVVYGVLSPAGAVDALYIVNHFTSEPGTLITDYGDYEAVSNLTNTEPLSAENGEVAFTSETDSFYYQGNLGKADLPWDFSIRYLLDGEELAPESLAGKSGRLEIRASVAPTGKCDPVFSENYMLQISVTLDTDLCKNIETPGGTPASAGKDTVVAYTVLPGNDADISLTADVRDFEMSGISITGVPYAMEMDFPDVSDSLGDLEQLPDAISQLNDGIGELESGTRDMHSGVQELASGSKSIKKGLSLLADSGPSLKRGSSQIESALAEMSYALSHSGADSIDLSSVKALPESLGALKGALQTLSGGLAELEEGYSLALGALQSAISSIPEASVSSEALQDLISRQTAPEDAALIGALAENYQAAQTVKGAYAQVSGAFSSVAPAIEQTIAGIGEITGQLDASMEGMTSQLSQLDSLSSLSRLTSGLAELSGNYAEFNDGLADYISGVSRLSSNYSQFDAGITRLSGGVNDLSSGVGELHQGTQTLSDEVSDLPAMIQDEIDKMKEEYLPGEFEPVSFASSKNENTDFVQFILQCEGIQLPEEDSEEPAPEPDETFWDRLTALFS